MRLPDGSFVSVLNRGLILLPNPGCTAVPKPPSGPLAYVPSFLADQLGPAPAAITVGLSERVGNAPVAQALAVPKRVSFCVPGVRDVGGKSLGSVSRDLVYWCSGVSNR